MKMHEYEMMMVRQGMMNPKAKKNFLGDLPSLERMVHEKVASLSPRSPHTPSKGGVIIRKLNIHVPKIIAAMLHLR